MTTAANTETFRVCDTTGLKVFKGAENWIKLNAVLAVVFLLHGGIWAVLLGLTRWPAVHFLSAEWYYRGLTLHGINMLIFWILFFEMAILQFASSVLLKTPLASNKWSGVGFFLMLAGAIMTDTIIYMGQGDVLMTSYIPLRAHWSFYLGMILFAVGALVNVLVFFATVYLAKKNKTYEGSMPLVVFGAVAAAIIAVGTILHGAVALIPAFLWSLDLIPQPDAQWYRLIWWGLGHPSQQINVCAMVATWYLLGTLTVGSQPLNERVCRIAFLCYILFINIASAHHLLVDPGVTAEWKIWNTSYAMYLAVFASMIHGFTVPASVEFAQRKNGFTRGLFEWISRAPWGNPGFSAMALSVVIFGFMGGITGVTFGTQQINIIAHNTLRITGHFHATVVGGTTLAFMGLTYYVLPLIFRKQVAWPGLAKIQPYIFGFGIALMAMSMTFAGSSGVPRRHWDVTFSNAPVPVDLGSMATTMLGLTGVGAVLAFTGLLLYCLIAVMSVFFGKKQEGALKSVFNPATQRPAAKVGGSVTTEGAIETPGTVVLTLVFLATFVVYFFANMKWLSNAWWVR
jgi:cytochrome c oxidase subunit 1